MKKTWRRILVLVMIFALNGCGSSSEESQTVATLPTSTVEVKDSFNAAPQFLATSFDKYSHTNETWEPAPNDGLQIVSIAIPFSRSVKVYEGSNLIGEYLLGWGMDILHGKTDAGDKILYLDAHAVGDPWGEKSFYVNGYQVVLPEISYGNYKRAYTVLDIRQFNQEWLIFKMATGENGAYFVEEQPLHWEMYNTKTQQWVDYGTLGLRV